MMKLFLISDDADALTGLHLAGVEGVLVSDAQEAEAAFKKALEDPAIGILLITDSIARLCPEVVKNMKLSRKTPLLVEIPNSDGSARPKDSIMKIVNEAIGI